MKYYECPNCRRQGLYPKSKMLVCKYCKFKMSGKAFSRQQLHHKNHIEGMDFVAPDSDLIKKKAPKVSKSKQHTELIVQRALRAIPNIWYTKLQVNQMAHTRTVGDYLVLAEDNNYVFECKELNTQKNKLFPFSRLSQMGDMKAFTKSMKKNLSYFVVLLWEGSSKTSPMYVIPLSVMEAHIKLSIKKSINNKEIELAFENYRVPMGNLEIYLKKLID